MKTFSESASRASYSRCRCRKHSDPATRAAPIGKVLKKRADERENVEKPINERKILDKEKGRMIFHSHASVFVLGVL